MMKKIVKKTANATVVRSAADQFSIELAEILREASESNRSAKSRTYQFYADYLNQRGISARRGGLWSAKQIERLLIRLKKLKSEGRL